MDLRVERAPAGLSAPYDPTEVVRPIRITGLGAQPARAAHSLPTPCTARARPASPVHRPVAPFVVRDVLTGRLGRIEDEEIWKPRIRWEAPTLDGRPQPELVDWSRLEAVDPVAISSWRTRLDLVVVLGLTISNVVLAWLMLS